VIVGFGTEILFMLMLGLLILGPKRLHTMLGRVAQAKAELENAPPPSGSIRVSTVSV
jgi:Sec-independent protein translocase protein TatA